MVAAQARNRGYAVQKGHVDVNHGRVRLDFVRELDRRQPVACLAHHGQFGRFLEQILETCGYVAELVRRALGEGRLPLVLGGDHSVALGTLGGLAAERGAGGVLWIDAHGDLNVPATTPTGNVHGMVLAAALGLAGPEFERDAWPMPSADRTRVAIVGARSLDPGERELVREHGLRVWTMSHVDRLGIERVLREA